MQSTKSSLASAILLLSSLIWVPDCISRHKFEFSINFDPLVIPIDLGTYIEEGPSYYDIQAKGNIGQAVNAQFSYWPIDFLGVSVGAGIRTFSSHIDYAFPSPIDEENGLIDFEGSYPFSAWGWGPSLSFHYRKDRWRARGGLGAFNLYDQEYNSISHFSGSTYFSGNEIIAEIELEEEAYWRYVPDNYIFLQFEGQYNLLDNVYLKFGFETTKSSRYPNPYTLKVSGFTENTTPEFHVLNDFKMTNKVSSFSFGVGYIIGFGKYKHVKNKSDMVRLRSPQV